jgi:hypothetical protein
LHLASRCPRTVLVAVLHQRSGPEARRAWLAACNAPLIHRLKRRSREDADPALARLIEEVESYLPGEPPAGAATQPVVSLRLQTPLGEVEARTDPPEHAPYSVARKVMLLILMKLIPVPLSLNTRPSGRMVARFVVKAPPPSKAGTEKSIWVAGR